MDIYLILYEKHFMIIYGKNIFLNHFYKINNANAKLNFLMILVQNVFLSNCNVKKFDSFWYVLKLLMLINSINFKLFNWCLVPQLKETFLNWVTLDDSNRDHLKSFVDKNTNMKIKLIMSALEQWDDLQKHGNKNNKFFNMYIFNFSQFFKSLS